MSVATKLLLPTLLLLIAFPTTSFALSCKERGSESAQIIASLGTNLAIPADAPDGTIIWESDLRTIEVICRDDQGYSGSEEIYFYLNPGNVNIGTGVRVGVRFGGVKLMQGNGKFFTGIKTRDCEHYQNYPSIYDNCKNNKTFPYTMQFSVFVEKYGKVPSSGSVSTVTNYRVFQIDGIYGLNTTPNSNLNYIINGLNNIRFVPCKANLTVTPETLNFERIAISRVQAGKVASSKNFTLGLSRSCNTTYTVNARFTPFKGSVLGGMLVPVDNSSVGISLRNLNNNQNVPFGTWFKLTDLVEYSSSNTFQADLIWRSKPVGGGKFNAGVTVDLYYQ